jgi:RNA polymerase sigma-70 factor (ECF subfamily)
MAGSFNTSTSGCVSDDVNALAPTHADLEARTDAELARLSQSGRRDAFEVLARRWGTRLWRFLCRQLGDEEEAHDACQEALTRAWINIHRLREPAHFKAWLHQIALNQVRDLGRRSSARALRLVQLDDGLDEPASQTAGPGDAAASKDLAAILGRVLALLPEAQRTAILLHELEGFTSVEIAAITGAPATTVRSRIFHGLKALRRHLRRRGVTRAALETGGSP